MKNVMIGQNTFTHDENLQNSVFKCNFRIGKYMRLIPIVHKIGRRIYCASKNTTNYSQTQIKNTIKCLLTNLKNLECQIAKDGAIMEIYAKYSPNIYL